MRHLELINHYFVEDTAWWDKLAGDVTITRAVGQMWAAFEERLRGLACGPESVDARLRAGLHRRAADDFRRLVEMAPLWREAAAGGKAHELKQLFDTCCAAVQKIIEAKIADQSMLQAQISWSATPDAPKVDKSVWDALHRSDAFIDLAAHLGTLDEWLHDTCLNLRHAGTLCKARAQQEFDHMRNRVLDLADAIKNGKCHEKLHDSRECSMDAAGVLRVMYSKHKYPVLFEMLYEDIEGDDPTPDFTTLETALFHALKSSHQIFQRMNVTQGEALTATLAELERALPTSEAKLAPLKKDVEMRHESLTERHHTRIAAVQNEVTRYFAKGEFNATAHRKMVDLRTVGEESDEYADACLELKQSLVRIIKDLKLGCLFVQLTPPEGLASFDERERIVCPWNSLQGALRTNHAVFLEGNQQSMQEAAAKRGEPSPEFFDLKAEVEQAKDELYHSLKHALAPLLSAFDSNELKHSAEGIHQISLLVDKLRGADGLFEKAQQAIAEARTQQVAYLRQLVDASSPAIEATAAKGNLKQWLSSTSSLMSQLEQLKKRGTLQAEYQTAFHGLIEQVQAEFRRRFQPVLSNEWQKLQPDQLNAIDKDLTAFKRWLSNEVTALMAQKLCINDDDLDLAEKRLAARRMSFVVVGFEHKEPSEQATIIDDHAQMPSEFSDFVERYRGSYVSACNQFKSLCKAGLETWKATELSDLMKRIRSFVQHDTFEVCGAVDTQPFVECERSLHSLYGDVSTGLKSIVASLSSTCKDEANLNTSLRMYLKGYVELVRLAIDAIDDRDLAHRATRLVEGGENVDPVRFVFEIMKTRASEARSSASEVLGLLRDLLESLQEDSMTPAQYPKDLEKMGAALERLQLWEGMPGEESILHFLVQLESLVPVGPPAAAAASPSLSYEPLPPSAPKLGALVTLLGKHNDRVRNAGKVICKQLDETLERLITKYDPSTDPPLPREPFELALCGQMDKLVNELAFRVEEVRLKRKEITTKVTALMSDFKQHFDARLQGKKYKEADAALKGLRRFEYLVEMAEFSQCACARQACYEEALRAHAHSMRDAALGAIPNAKRAEDLAQLLMQLKQFEDGVPLAAKVTREAIKEILVALKKKFPTSMTMLATAVQSLDSVLGNSLVNSSDVFAAMKVELFNQRTQMDFADVLKGIEGEPGIDRPTLEKRFREYEAQYQQDLNWAFGTGVMGRPVEWLVMQAKERTKTVYSRSHRAAGSAGRAGKMAQAAANWAGFRDDSQNQVPKVLAAICALWSVQFYLETKDESASSGDGGVTTRAPHPVQALCILRLLGSVDSGRVHLENHIAEVPTGEGKSLVLAVTAATLALYGYHVDCVCYSGNLSSRDNDAFASLFDALGLNDGRAELIRYGTFDELSERLMTEKHGDVRSQMQASLTGQPLAGSHGPDHAPTRVLLIDEVDVFLDPNFFGGVYRPSLTIGDERVSKLMRAIWNDPSQKVTDLPEYAGLFKKPAVIFKGDQKKHGFEWYAQSAALDMQRAAADFKKKPQVRGSDYQLIDGWVWYKQQDGLVRSDKLTYMWMTNCVYLDLCDKGSISEEQLLDHGLHLYAVCGEFSYALLPSTERYSDHVPAFYKFILGVTGTLREGRLPREARELLEDEIRIKHMTYCPSMYGPCVRDWDPASKDNVKVSESKNEHFLMITDEISRRLKPTSQSYDGKRSVLVFFESLDELQAYFDSSFFRRFQDGANRLTEAACNQPDERASLISKATRQGQVTLATRSFGRGIDFVVDDEHMLTVGGLHVLLTFFPRDVQEEVQIMGRGARQGQKGSFSLMLRSDQLEDLAGGKASADDIKAWLSDSTLYEKMSEIRSAQAAADMKERLEKAEDAKKQHEEAAAALNAFSSSGGRDSSQLSKLLRKYNHVGGSTTSRTLMLIDVTYSMNSLIEKTKSCIGTFFDRCQKVLDAENIASGFALQIAGYSNYNVDVERIVEASTWEAKPHNLAQFLGQLETRGGWGEEAIECGLMHALAEHKSCPIDQIILIGDASANSLSDMAHKRMGGHHGGERYWSSARPSWAPSGIAQKEAVQVLNDIQQVKPVPVHCYHMHDRAVESFEKMAAVTGGGSAQRLDVNSASGAQALTDAVCKQILSSLGGQALADAYERMKPSFSR
ncbi:hypothetical protein EMIHUDRAFT_205325 [Emiliania huxleyi CCMP1516]|uniref:SecA family profile domain-containing protein n=2 Tax=Emiliania huxleyi TaxID=2903 RepID=A0A0D3JS48_EMIH1|nr:hypothetical protein EMIHUDRAFT_205325 [Emiliania huxleyi CCMP1516]EOD26333.1 hypothetical protein EMIHUDRAFT_205325 [Emiliania huxleyi CCMP1516]|eukprot:XP_005778762.1 hypothetical protein EMIHUDRAFT_205325 [Emiliania huxleyi CCMP1516]